MPKTLSPASPFDLTDFHALLKENIERVNNDPEFLASLTEERQGNPITLGPRVVTADKWAEDMATAAKNKAAKWLENSLKPKKDPKERAKKASKKYDNNMRAALDEKRWDDGIDAYDEGVRQATIAAVGESGYRSGIDTHAAKAKHKITKLQPLVAALTVTLDAMDVDTPEQRAAKMVAARDGMLAIKKEMRK
ncbi:hypothetical protein ES705_10491 [subsurface metagenome]